MIAARIHKIAQKVILGSAIVVILAFTACDGDGEGDVGVGKLTAVFSNQNNRALLQYKLSFPPGTRLVKRGADAYVVSSFVSDSTDASDHKNIIAESSKNGNESSLLIFSQFGTAESSALPNNQAAFLLIIPPEARVELAFDGDSQMRSARVLLDGKEIANGNLLGSGEYYILLSNSGDRSTITVTSIPRE